MIRFINNTGTATGYLGLMMASRECSNMVKKDAVCSNFQSQDDNRSNISHGQTCASSSLTKTGDGEANSCGGCDGQLPVGLMLKKALVVFRHGARTPIYTIPNIPQATYEEKKWMADMPETTYNYDVIDARSKGPRPFSNADASYASVVLEGGAVSGQLTLVGQQGTFKLGQALRKEYVDNHKLIDGEYNKDQVFLKSTNMNRTVKSLVCVLGGLFGVESLGKAPVQIPVANEGYEVLIPNPAFCPNLQLFHVRAQKNSELESGTLQDRLIVEKCIGIDSTVQQIKWIETRDDLVARMAHNLEIPKELEPHLEMIDKNATMQLYNALCGQTEEDTQTACMLSCGKAINMFLEHLEMDSDEGGYKLYLYSCHDSTLTALLGAFDIFDYKWPPFAADLRIELYEDKNAKKFVKLSYLSKGVVSRGCKEIFSPYDTFVEGISPLAVNADSHAIACCSKKIQKLAQGNIKMNEVTSDTQKPTKAVGL